MGRRGHLCVFFVLRPISRCFSLELKKSDCNATKSTCSSEDFPHAMMMATYFIAFRGGEGLFYCEARKFTPRKICVCINCTPHAFCTYFYDCYCPCPQQVCPNCTTWGRWEGQGPYNTLSSETCLWYAYTNMLAGFMLTHFCMICLVSTKMFKFCVEDHVFV